MVSVGYKMIPPERNTSTAFVMSSVKLVIMIFYIQ
jgi:hypothetical protein